MVAELRARFSDPDLRPGPWAYLAVPLLYWLGAAIGSRLATTADGISLLWLPNAILVAALVRFRGRSWGWFALLAFAAEIAADLHKFTVVEASVFGAANLVEASVTWILLDRWGFDPRFLRVADVGRFVLAGPILGALTGATIGTAFLRAVSPPEGSFVDSLLVWWFGDGLGLLTLTPFYLSLWFPQPKEARPLSSPVLVDVVMGAIGLGVLALMWLSSAQPYGTRLRPLLLLPFVLYAASRLRLRWISLLVVVLSLLVTGMTVVGRSLYGYADPESAALWTQEFVLVMSVVALGACALLANVRFSEAQTARANVALRQQTEALAQSNAELRRIAFVAAHDLQTPLRSIGRFTQLLGVELAGKLGPTADDWIRRVTESTRRLEEQLGDLGTLAAVDASEAAFVPVDVDALLDDVLRDNRGTLERAGATVTREPLPTVRGDRAQLGRLLEELVVNAVKFRRVDPPRVHVSAREGPAEWVFSVRDNGMGVEKAERERIFELFYRPAEARGFPGTGFGLAMCARVVHRHGGRIWVEPAPGSGSIFCFTLPREPSA